MGDFRRWTALGKAIRAESAGSAVRRSRPRQICYNRGGHQFQPGIRRNNAWREGEPDVNRGGGQVSPTF